MKNKQQIIERLEAITNSSIASDVLFKRNGKNWTIIYFNCSTNKHFKATVKHSCLISNIRETKDKV